MKTDTIAAIATALSESGIGIVRISGPDAITIADSVFQTKNGKKILKNVDSHTVHYGYIFDEEMIDEVMVVVMKAPRSYTTEDTVEINCHGGILVMQKILETVLKYGARLAEPGEFTKRAFLNGRIDLSKAEAVMDLIHSQNEYALESSISQLKGNLSEKVKELRSQIIYEIAFIESALDDPEHIDLTGYPERLNHKLESLISEISHLLQTADNGRIIREGISTVIVGKPNAGKSSLLNLLVGEERAIVTDIAGTTRDVLQESVRLNGVSLNVIDTAGIRDTEDVVEKIGVERAKKYAADADLIIYVVDTSVPFDQNDRDIIPLLKDKKVIILFNKTDLKSVVSKEDMIYSMNDIVPDIYEVQNISILPISAKKQIGLSEFEHLITDMFFAGEIKQKDEIVITNIRHKEALQDALSDLKMVKRSVEDDMPEDFYSIDLMSAYSALGKIIGESVEDDLVEEIFSKFCMGK